MFGLQECFFCIRMAPLRYKEKFDQKQLMAIEEGNINDVPPSLEDVYTRARLNFAFVISSDIITKTIKNYYI